MVFDLHLLARLVLLMVKSTALALLAHAELAGLVLVFVPLWSVASWAVRVISHVRAIMNYMVVERFNAVHHILCHLNVCVHHVLSHVHLIFHKVMTKTGYLMPKSGFSEARLSKSGYWLSKTRHWLAETRHWLSKTRGHSWGYLTTWMSTKVVLLMLRWELRQSMLL